MIADNPILIAKFTFNKIPEYSDNSLIRKMYFELNNKESNTEIDNGKLDKILTKYPLPIKIK